MGIDTKNELPMVRPFSCGTQYGDWGDANCRRCTKGADLDNPPSRMGCDIEQALLEAYFGEGKVTESIARRMGLDGAAERDNWPCREWEVKPEIVAAAAAAKAKRAAETQEATTMNLDWLTTITDPDGASRNAPLLRKHPHNLTLDNQPWAVATDGYILVMIDGRNEFTPADDKTAKTLAGVLDREYRPAGETDVLALREWCGPVEGERKEDCDCCHGSGDCECPSCEAVHKCGQCKGSGKVAVGPDRRPGVIAAVVIDRNRLAKAVAHLSDGRCRVGTSPAKDTATAGMVRIDGDGWAVLLAAIEMDPAKCGGPVLKVEQP